MLNIESRALALGSVVALFLTSLAGSQALAATGVPLTDLVLFGAVYDPGGQRVTGALPAGARIAAFADGLITPGEGGEPDQPTILAETAELLDGGTGTAQYYVLRIRRFDGLTTDHDPADTFVLAGDRLHIHIDWDGDGDYEPTEEVAETRDASLLVTDAPADLRLLNLNSPVTDLDGDGLPDDWEEFFLGGTGQGWDDDGNQDGVNNGLAWAMGLNPNLVNTSKMPFLEKNQDGNLVIYFRQTTEVTVVNYHLEGSDSMEPGSWALVTDATIEDVGVEGTSRILKATILEGFAARARFYRINWR